MDKKDNRLFIIFVPEIPQTGAWAAQMLDGSIELEGDNGATWNNINHDNVKSYNILGMAVPVGHKCCFRRIGKAGIGGQVVPHTIVFSAEKEGVTIEFRFCNKSVEIIKM